MYPHQNDHKIQTTLKNAISDMLPRDEGHQGQCLGPSEQTSAYGTEKESK